MSKVVVTQYNNVTPELLAWLTLIGAVLSSGANWLMEKYYSMFKRFGAIYLVLDVVATAVASVGAVYFDPRFYIGVSMTLHLFLDVFIMTMWEYFKQVSGDGRLVQNQFGKMTGVGRAIGLVLGVFLAQTGSLVDYNFVMWWLVISSAVTNWYFYLVCKLVDDKSLVGRSENTA